jgi:hypothetical protein
MNELKSILGKKKVLELLPVRPTKKAGFIWRKPSFESGKGERPKSASEIVRLGVSITKLFSLRPDAEAKLDTSV